MHKRQSLMTRHPVCGICPVYDCSILKVASYSSYAYFTLNTQDRYWKRSLLAVFLKIKTKTKNTGILIFYFLTRKSQHKEFRNGCLLIKMIQERRENVAVFGFYICAKLFGYNLKRSDCNYFKRLNNKLDIKQCRQTDRAEQRQHRDKNTIYYKHTAVALQHGYRDVYKSIVAPIRTR